MLRKNKLYIGCIFTFCRYCGYVVDNGDNQFQFHGFFCDPNSDKLCLALHSACQSRYQRVIDAHMTDEDTAQDSNVLYLYLYNFIYYYCRDDYIKNHF